ncbi:MAG TPA: glycosyltransferase, partial [Acidimicrobiales bacterium]|nr:glycosyltransferase [Acidimicrobiales bacterium]
PPEVPGTTLFTASRLDAPKRIGLIIDAMAHVSAPVRLRIAGTGPLGDALRARAAGDRRIEFLGFVPDDELIAQYRDAIAVPFVPDDEDQGLICGEAASQGTPVVTCSDSGGPTEFVVDGVNGLITEPTPEALGHALDRVAADPEWARILGRAAHRRAAGRTWREAVGVLIGESTPRLRRRHEPVSDRPGKVTSPGGFRQRRRALVLATYGIDDPGHGGELRVHHLCRSLAPSMDVDVLALVASPGTRATTTQVAPGLTSTVIPRGRRQARIEDDLGLLAGQPITDILAGVDAHFTAPFLERLRSLASRADLVVLAQPFLHPALAKAKVDLPFLVDTQNVEIDLRTQSLGDSPVAPPILDMLRRVEHDALVGAVAVSACSAADADRLAELYGLERSSIVVIPNGTTVPKQFRDPEARIRARRRWFTRLHWTWGSPGAEELGVFFGSWHLPNLDAAEFLIGLADDCPELFVVSAGNHGTAFAHRTLPDNIIFPGVVSDTVKSPLLSCASVALNPMRIGSGTNLKLIESLGHGVPTISTPFGARGLDLTDGRELLLVDPEGFLSAARDVFADPSAAAVRARAGWEFAQDFGWDVIGAAYRELVGGLLGVPLAA